ncbi:MAG: TetR/AcrR family transcriptional regulator [Gaiellaceae bacterium]
MIQKPFALRFSKRAALSTSATVVSESRCTRDLILDAAERRFAERGFTGVSVREIAADAGLKNQASLYNHFRNKRALYEATLARGLEPIAALVASRDQQPITAGLEQQAIEAFLDRVLDYLQQHPHLPRLIQRAGLDDSRYLRNAATRLLRPLYAQGMRVLESASAPWEPAQLPQLAAGLYHLIFGYFANAGLLQAVVQGDPLGAVAVARQRRFLKTAVAQLLGVSATPRPQRRRRINGKEAAV